ncbi:ABC transporter permease [Halobacteria archaeon AArc-m2/3/4]|uniref:ABC transporter permease n=1 Tax=Natronoglomus mannanivorans TaxID=2979990 RepID=A0ABT2QKL2_9EURY|nr:ABC transporter permease [Halobacteria archaeon AArc-m2/3/4]
MNYYVKRVLQSLFTIWAVLTITFVLIRWMPGGPLDYLMAQFVQGNLGPSGTGVDTQERIAAFERMAEVYINFDPTAPLYVQYFEYVGDVLTGNLGRSIWYQQPVEEVLFPAIPWTVFIGAVAIFISFISRVIVGAALAYKEGSKLDIGGTTLLIWGHSIPFYVVAILLLYTFGYQFGWFPVSGRYNPDPPAGLNWPFIAGILHHAALPMVALAWASFGAGAIAMRANAIQILGEDYLRAAKLRGITSKRITLLYVARNAILPMYTQMLIQVGFIFSGSIILEMVFEYRGVGWYMFQAIQNNDYPLMMGCFLLITVTIAIAMLVADLTYGLVDPRVRRGESSESF